MQGVWIRWSAAETHHRENVTSKLALQRWSLQRVRVSMKGCSAGAAAMFSSYKRLNCYSLLQDPLPGVEVHVVRAANSDRWSKKELQQLHEAEEPSEQPKVILMQDRWSLRCELKQACLCLLHHLSAVIANL